MTTADRSFYVTGGTLPFDASSYVERQADKDLRDGLRAGEFCYVLNTRQMGKSSLMVRTAMRLRQEGVAVAILDLTAIGQNLTAEQWYDGLLVSLSEQLGWEDELCDFWQEHSDLGPMQRFFAAIGRVALPRLGDKHLALFVDEIDAVRSLPFPADEFFAGVRECYNRRSQNREFERLSICLLGVATPADLISDTRISPFNIGRRVVITDFTPEEAMPLTKGLPGGPSVLARVLYWTGGHPYMTQRLCRTIAETQAPITTNAQVDGLCERLFLTKQARDADDNLAFVRNRLLRSEVDLASLLDLYMQVRGGRKVKDDETSPLTGVLRLSGVTTVDQVGCLRVRNRIYDRVFDREWILAHMPDAELRRQKAAYRAGMLRVLSVSGVVAAALATLSILAVGYAQQANINFRSAEASRRDANANAQRAERLRQEADASAVQAGKNAIKATTMAARARTNADHARREARRANKNEMRAQTALARALAEERKARLARAEAETSNGRSLRLAGERQVALREREGALRERSSALKEAIKAERRANEASGIARKEATRAQQLTYVAQMSVAQREWEANRAANVQAALDQAEGRESDQGFEWGFWNHALHGEQTTLREVSGILHVATSADGAFLLTTHQNRPPILWNTQTRLPLRTLEGRAAAFSRDGRFIATAGSDNRLRIQETVSGRPVKEIVGQSADVRALAFAPDGTRIAVAEGRNTVRVWDIATGAVAATLEGHKKPVLTLAFSPDGNTLATGGEDHTTRLWNAKTGKPRHTLAAQESDVREVAFSPDSKRVASASLDGTVKVWGELNGPRPIQDLVLKRTSHPIVSTMARQATSDYIATLDERTRGHRGGVCSVAFSPDGKRLLTGGSYDNTARVWDAVSGRELQVFAGHTSSVLGVTFLPDGRRIVTGDSSGIVRFWSADDGPGHAHRLPVAPDAKGTNALAFFPDGKRLVTAHDDGKARIWDTKTRQEVGCLEGHKGAIRAVVVSRDGSQIATGSDDKTARVWDARTGKLRRTLTVTTGQVVSLAFSGDGSRLAAGCGDLIVGNIKRYVVWETATGAREGIGDGVTNLVSMPNSFRFLHGGNLPHGSYIENWNVPGARKSQTLRVPETYLNLLAITPNGKRVAASGFDNAVYLLDTATGRGVMPPMRAHQGDVTGLAFSPDGRRLATAGGDATVRLWDTRTGDGVLTLTDHDSKVNCIAFSPDGRQLAAGSQNGLVTIWEAAAPQQIAVWKKENQEWRNRRQETLRDDAIKAERAAESPEFLDEVRERRLPERSRAQTPPNLFRDQGWLVVPGVPRDEVEWTMRRESAGVFRVEVRRISTAPWGIQLFHPNLTLEPRRKYILQFRARANRPATVPYTAQRQVAKWESVTNRNQQAVFTEHWRAFRLYFTTNDMVIPNNCSVVLHLGGQIGTYWIADLMLVPDPEDASTAILETPDAR